MIEDREFFNEDWHLQPFGENGVLFTAEYVALLRKRSPYMFVHRDQAEIAINKALDYTSGDYLSHDNMTGIVCLSRMVGLSYHLKYMHRDWWRRAHPRDVAFYLWNLGSFFKLLALPLMPILFGSMIWACWHNERSNGTLDTDGKLLSWLRCEAMGWRKFQSLLHFIVKKRHNVNWHGIFEIYFPFEDHPNVRHAKAIYGEEK